MKKLQIVVVGGRNVSEEIFNSAQIAGREIAKRGAILICGGLGGVMEAACRGAKEEGGLTVGILPTSDALDANSYIDIVIPTGMGIARNVLIINAADGVLAIGGQYGTLSEMAFARQTEKPLISLKSWAFDDSYVQAQSPKEAVDLLFKAI